MHSTGKQITGGGILKKRAKKAGGTINIEANVRSGAIGGVPKISKGSGSSGNPGSYPNQWASPIRVRTGEN